MSAGGDAPQVSSHSSAPPSSDEALLCALTKAMTQLAARVNESAGRDLIQPSREKLELKSVPLRIA